MVKIRTKSFVHTLKLKVSPQEQKILDKRLEVARQIYNACLGESLNRLKGMQASKTYQTARRMMKSKERKALFDEARRSHAFSEYALHAYVKTIRSGWLGEHIDANTAQKIATRAYQAVSRYGFKGVGRPRFRANGRFSSMEGKSNASGIRWRDSQIHWNSKHERLVLSVCFDQKDKYGVEAHALSCRTKYVRLLRRRIKGRGVWYAQLIQEGVPLMKQASGDQTIGLDLGPSSLAYVAVDGNHVVDASLGMLCPEVDECLDEIKRLQRQLSRSQRAMNPDYYEKDRFIKKGSGRCVRKLGKSKKGRHDWQSSKRYKRISASVAELKRKTACAKNCSHGALSNKIIRMGRTIQTEKLSYKAWQKLYGKSVGKRAPGLLLEKLRYKAENAGGGVIEFSPRQTALSQTCQCGHRKKKRLSERWHMCSHCGIKAQRDLYSAFLACFVKEDQLNRHQALAVWPSAGMLLEEAMLKLHKTAMGKTRLSSFGLRARDRAVCLQKEESTACKVLDVVT